MNAQLSPSSSHGYRPLRERAWLVAKSALEAQSDVWEANPAALLSASFKARGCATPANAGWRVSGHWQFVRGIAIAEWCVFCTTRARDAGGPGCDANRAPLSAALRIRIRRNQGFAAKQPVSAVDRLFTTAGGRGIYLDHSMQHALGLPLSSTAY